MTAALLDETAVPGTVRLVDSQHELHGISERGDIILVPQPTADPEDPLNWSPWRKRRAMFLTHLYTFVIAWSSAAVYSILVNVSEDTGLSVSTLNQGSGTMLLFFGWGALVAQPVALNFGRRGVILLSLLGTVAIATWTAYAPSYAAWVSTRVLLGLFGSPIEVLPEVVVTDLFFNHERGLHIGVYMLMLTGGNYLCAVFSGIIDNTMSWQWVMYWCAIINAIAFVVLFFGFEETMYHRNTGFEATRESSGPGQSDTSSAVVSVSVSDKETKATPRDAETGLAASASPVSPASADAAAFPPPRSYLQKLGLFRVPEGPTHFLAYVYLPLKNYYTFPVVLWASFYHGIAVVCFNALNATASVILSAAPYNFKSTCVGLAYIGPTIGAVVGAVWSGVINDKICLYMARRDKHGLREAEHRLYAAVVMCIVPPVGFIVWGVGASRDVHWVGLVFGMGMLGFALTAGGGLMLNYITDSYKELQGSTMSSLNVMRCTMAFGFSYAVNPWLAREGSRDTFITWSLMSFALFGTFVPMIVYGKRLRVRSTRAYWAEVNTSVGLYH